VKSSFMKAANQIIMAVTGLVLIRRGRAENPSTVDRTYYQQRFLGVMGVLRNPDTVGDGAGNMACLRTFPQAAWMLAVLAFGLS